MHKLRLGFLGIGAIGRQRMEMILSSGVGRAEMICEPDPKMLQDTLKAAPEARVAVSYDEMLEAGLDGMVIATPGALHAEHAVKALDRGIAVFCQRPLGRTAAEVGRVVDAARRADRLLEVDFSYRFTTALQRIRNSVAEGAIGEIFGVDLVFQSASGPDRRWYYDSELSGGGCVMNLGSRLVDLALWVLGFPEVTRVSSRLFVKGRPLPARGRLDEAEDFARITMELKTGASLQLSCAWNLQEAYDLVIEASFYGTRGGLVFRNVNGSAYDFTAERVVGTTREILASPPDAWGGRAAVAWARRLAGGAGFERECTSVLPVARVIDSIYGRH